MQCILLRIHQYWVRIIYKLGPAFFIAVWLPWHNHMENNDEEIHGMDIMVDAIHMLIKCPLMHVNPAHVAGNYTRCIAVKRVHVCTMAGN